MKNFRVQILTFIFLLTFYNSYSGQILSDTTIRKTNKINFFFSIGTQYHSLLHDNYFPLDTFVLEREIMLTDYHGFVGKTYVPTFGFQSAIMCDYLLYKRLDIQSGLRFYVRREKFEMNDDATERNIVNSFNIQHSYSLDTFKTIINSSLNIEVPVFIGYSIKRFNFSVGANVTTLTLARVHATSINNFEMTDYVSHDIFNLNFSPSIKIKYLLPFDKVNISSYLAIDKRYWKYYDFQIGFDFKLCSIK